MTDRHDTADDVDLVRAQLHCLVDEVEPRPDSLPRLLAASRRRRAPRRPLIAVAGAAAIAAAFLVAVVVSPSEPPRMTEPVSTAPNSYIAQAKPGVIASFDVVSGRQLDQVAHVPGTPTGALATDGDRIYTAVSGDTEAGIVEVSADGARRVVESRGESVEVLAAGAGRIAYVERDGVVIEQNGAQHRIPARPGLRVIDLALGEDGRLAILAMSDVPGASGIYVVDPAAVSIPERPTIVGLRCAPWAVSWTGTEVAALSPMDCGSSDEVRIGTFDSGSGEQIGAGVPFEVRSGPLDRTNVRLSTDRLGRFLVSGADTRQWLVDGADVLEVPPACAPDGACAEAPAMFWG